MISEPEFTATLLALIRVAALISSVPILGSRQVPNLWKATLALTLTAFLAPSLPAREVTGGTLALAAAVLWEMAVGLSLGTMVQVALAAAGAAGSVLDAQAGLANASVFNPAAEQPQPLLASFYQTLLALMLLAVDFHDVVILALAKSFVWLPSGVPQARSWLLLNGLLQLLVRFSAIALAISLPILLAFVGVEVALALISRALPQINMLLAGAPIRIMAAWALVAAGLPLTLNLMERTLTELLPYLNVPGGGGYV